MLEEVLPKDLVVPPALLATWPSRSAGRRGVIVSEGARWSRNSRLVRASLHHMLTSSSELEAMIGAEGGRAGHRLPEAETRRLTALFSAEMTALQNPWVDNRLLRTLFHERSGFGAVLRYRDAVREEVRGGRARGRNAHLARAFEAEVLRRSSLTPAGVPHRSLAEFLVGGYRVPSGAVLRYDIVGTQWNEQLCENLVPYGIGLRRCTGEEYAQAYHFLMMGGLLREFTVALPPGRLPPTEEATMGLTRNCLPFEAVLTSLPQSSA
ncbi:steroid 21-hydroxylase-like [Pollicipes pollicipes]|uniref:steroid 21-hydroxylase-like n=1 Tax=Pollicipes pollicipes TaxID=41117 RepID=UPI0018857169|nr:steroid 21-hydroxylase-like [Pollicipes pollicipes]